MSKSSITPSIEVKEINKSKTYIVSLPFHKNIKCVQDEVNKVELIFKSLGIKNIRVIPYQIGLFEVKE